MGRDGRRGEEREGEGMEGEGSRSDLPPPPTHTFWLRHWFLDAVALFLTL